MDYYFTLLLNIIFMKLYKYISMNHTLSDNANLQLYNRSFFSVNILSMPAARWRTLRIRRSIWAIAKLDCRYRGSRSARRRNVRFK